MGRSASITLPKIEWTGGVSVLRSRADLPSRGVEPAVSGLAHVLTYRTLPALPACVPGS